MAIGEVWLKGYFLRILFVPKEQVCGVLLVRKGSRLFLSCAQLSAFLLVAILGKILLGTEIILSRLVKTRKRQAIA